MHDHLKPFNRYRNWSLPHVVVGAAAIALSLNAGVASAICPDSNVLPVGTDKGGLVTYYFLGQGGRKGTTFQPDGNNKGGVRVAAGDVNGDGIADLITGPGKGPALPVRIFDGKSLDTEQPTQLASFFPFTNEWTDGVFVAAGDMDGDGTAEILIGQDASTRVLPAIQLPTLGSQVRIFSLVGDGSVIPVTGALSAIVPFADFNGGVRVATVDYSLGGRELICAAGPGGGPHVKLLMPDGSVHAQFLAYDPAFAGGVWVAAGDVNGDGVAEIVTGPGPSKNGLIALLLPAVQAFAFNPNNPNQPFSVAHSIVPYGPVRGGIRVGIVCITTPCDSSPDSNIFVAPGPGGALPVKQFRFQSTDDAGLGNPAFYEIGFGGFHPFGTKSKNGILIGL
ncbi:MAG: FG-GAP repeat domain-containing protein [Candidatus Sumerlaeaceae bacterium]